MSTAGPANLMASRAPPGTCCVPSAPFASTQMSQIFAEGWSGVTNSYKFPHNGLVLRSQHRRHEELLYKFYDIHADDEPLILHVVPVTNVTPRFSAACYKGYTLRDDT
ncbi:hypothetical protein E2C01_059078 [Portunus trituberculatus]|uniref:Uncharacterized protein n=1 Tax=Portunus trituberculatus TaxID=210409 RepID=A0A5B7H6G1_PORTR|nr:hypothetical protein [Portunus trituberculatus]